MFSTVCQEGRNLVSHPVIKVESKGRRSKLIREKERRKCLIDADFFRKRNKIRSEQPRINELFIMNSEIRSRYLSPKKDSMVISLLFLPSL
jgi:hypothetical protein